MNSKKKDKAAMISDKAATDQVKVVFTPSGRRHNAVGTPVLDRGTPTWCRH